MVYQSNPSPYKHNMSCFSEAFTFPGLEADSYQLPIDHGEDFVVPDVFFSPPPPPQQLIFPTLPADCTTCCFPAAAAAAVGSDEPVLNAQIAADHDDLLIHDYGTNFSSVNFHPQQLGIIRNWEVERERKHAAETESSSTKVGRYSVEERRDRILRYLKKRNHRNFNKTIKYACRKTLADRRIRVRGRFAKNNDDANDIKHIDMSPLEDTISPSPYYDQPYDSTQMMRQDGEGWLQEAITSLMYNNIPPWQGGFALHY